MPDMNAIGMCHTHSMPPEPKKNFHVPLPSETYEELRAEASALDVPATTIVREAVEGWLEERRMQRLRDEIATYAEQAAGTSADLDPELERAAAAELKRSSERK